ANILVLGRADQIGLVDFGATGKLTDDDMSKLVRLFIDAASENVDALPRRLADLGVRYPKEREEEFLAELRELYYRYYGASLQEIDPLQVRRAAGVVAARAGGDGDAVPGARLPRGDPRRTDRGRLRPQGARGVYEPDGRRLQPAGRRDDRRRRADRLEPDRDLREGGAAPPRH